MGTEVLPAVDSKGKKPLHPMPSEVELPPTAEEDPEMPEGGDNEGMEEPPSTSAATTATTIRRMAQLTSARVTLDQGWATYAAVHQIKTGYMVTFKLLTPDTLMVIIFNDDGIEVDNKCGKHDEAFAAKE
ncbi:hypothetical protein VPH35_072066 [Triticum aestivum]